MALPTRLRHRVGWNASLFGRLLRYVGTLLDRLMCMISEAYSDEFYIAIENEDDDDAYLPPPPGGAIGHWETYQGTPDQLGDQIYLVLKGVGIEDKIVFVWIPEVEY